jgi:DNA gyrase subunit A
VECVKRRLYFDLHKKRDKLHLLHGLRKILLDIDRAIAIIRETDSDAEVIPNLMIGFGIDELQADYIAEIRLRDINRAHILRRLEEVSSLEGEIARLEDILGSRSKVLDIIVGELKGIIKKYPTQRHTTIVYDVDDDAPEGDDGAEDTPVHLFFTREGYAKKITPASLRMSGEQKLKEGDAVAQVFETTSRAVALVLTNQCQAYKFQLSDLPDGKASALGEYLPQTLGMDAGETPVFLALPGDYTGFFLLVFANGKVAKIEDKAFETKTRRKRLTGAYSDKSPLAAAFHMEADGEILLSAGGRMLIFNTATLTVKASRTTQGVAVMTLRRGGKVESARALADAALVDPARYRTRTLPAAGARIAEADLPHVPMRLE